MRALQRESVSPTFQPAFLPGLAEEKAVQKHTLLVLTLVGQGKPSRSKDSSQVQGSEQLVASVGEVIEQPENWSDCKSLKGVVKPKISF